MKVVFMGTPEFSVPTLDALASGRHEVAAVVTQPDRPKGRGRKLTPSPVKAAALEHGIRVLQPERVRAPEFLSEIKAIGPEVIVTIAFGQILPRELLEIPPGGCINVHPSLLPRHRGAAPVNWSIIKGDAETGVTTIMMDEGMDTGDILLQHSIPIDDNDTAGSLHDKLSRLGADLLLETLELLEEGGLEPVKQDHGQASHAPTFRKTDGRIDWSLSAEDVWNRIRGLNPWPGAFTEFQGEPLKILSAGKSPGQGKPGEIIDVGREGVVTACGRGAIKIMELQLAGKRRMSAAEFIRGHRVEKGDFFR